MLMSLVFCFVYLWRIKASVTRCLENRGVYSLQLGVNIKVVFDQVLDWWFLVIFKCNLLVVNN